MVKELESMLLGGGLSTAALAYSVGFADISLKPMMEYLAIIGGPAIALTYYVWSNARPKHPPAVSSNPNKRNLPNSYSPINLR